MRFQVGTDVGGTFTDVWVRAGDGSQAVLKSPSTADIIGGILNALELAADLFGLSVQDFCAAVERFGHGTTAGLNALLTSSAARTALVTTAGFGDTLEIGRLKRQLAGLTELEIGDYTNRGRWPAVVPRQLVVEVAERVDSVGEVVVPLSVDEVERVLDHLSTLDVQVVAVVVRCSRVAVSSAGGRFRGRDPGRAQHQRGGHPGHRTDTSDPCVHVLPADSGPVAPSSVFWTAAS
jgi:N-methylhydantoinase A